MMANRKNQIRALLKSIETGDATAVSVVNEVLYIQHNPQTHEGSEGLAHLFKRLSITQPRVNMVRVFEDRDFVFAHMEYDFSSRKICFEVFRFENGQAVEHWDNIQERHGPNPSGRSMVDGPTLASDPELTETNRSLVRLFVETVLVNKRLERIPEFISDELYAEHNPTTADGAVALRARLERSENGQVFVDYRHIHFVLAEGNFVLCVSEGALGGAQTAFYDLFRIEKGRLVEHWDTTEKIAPHSEWKNNNGKF